MLPFDSSDLKQSHNDKFQFIEGKLPDYFRRLCDVRQLDFEAAFDQLITLMSLEPQNV
jgi:hypothetical protein